MGSQTFDVLLSALSTALGAIVLWVLSGMRSDIREIRTQTASNQLEIAVHREALENAKIIGRES